MTNVDDKLKVFAKIILEKVQQDSENRMEEFTRDHNELLNREKQNIVKQSESIIRQVKKKAEVKKNAIISKANMDRQHALLKKRKEVFDQTVEDLKRLADDFTGRDEYVQFIEKCIVNGLNQMESKKIEACFTKKDMEAHAREINDLIAKYKKDNTDVLIKTIDRNIIGGCIFQDDGGTMRVDCSMLSMIEDNRVLIGKILMDNL